MKHSRKIFETLRGFLIKCLCVHRLDLLFASPMPAFSSDGYTYFWSSDVPNIIIGRQRRAQLLAEEEERRKAKEKEAEKKRADELENKAAEGQENEFKEEGDLVDNSAADDWVLMTIFAFPVFLFVIII